MGKIEVCQIEHGWDTKQEASRWWEARLVAEQGDHVIDRMEYWDEGYRSDKGYGIGDFLKDLLPGDNRAVYKRLEESKKLHTNANARLVARLMQDGWEIAATDNNGLATMMKRNVA